LADRKGVRSRGKGKPPDHAHAESWGFLASLPDPAIVVGRRGRLLAANRQASRLFGYRDGEMTGLPLGAIVPARHRRHHASLHARFAAEPAARRMVVRESVGLRKDGSEFPAEISIGAVRGGGAAGFVAAVRDLTPRRAEEHALAEDRRWLLDRLMAAQDEERRRIARELHDEAGQALASLIVRLRGLQDAPSLPDAKRQALALRRALSDTILDLGRLARGLHPSLLDDLGLAPALKRQAADSAEAMRIPVRVKVAGLGPRRMPQPVETALFRIAQEALTNVARHAGARMVEIALTRNDGAVRLVVRDDGRGFDPRALGRRRASGRSLGLLGIRERAAALSGTATIESAPGRGTTVSVALPLGPARAARRRARGGKAR